jgi:putative ABC transport system substrate-binding protein
MCPWRNYVDAGSLMSYRTRRADVHRHLAYYCADKLRKGARTADLPVEQPMTFELIINRTTAKALELTLPLTLLLLADEVLE